MKRLGLSVAILILLGLGWCALTAAADASAEKVVASPSATSSAASSPQPAEPKYFVAFQITGQEVELNMGRKVSRDNTLYLDLHLHGGTLIWKGKMFVKGQITAEMLNELLNDLPPEVLGSKDGVQVLRDSISDIRMFYDNRYASPTLDSGNYTIYIVAPTKELVQERAVSLIKVLNYLAQRDRPATLIIFTEETKDKLAKEQITLKEQEKVREVKPKPCWGNQVRCEVTGCSKRLS